LHTIRITSPIRSQQVLISKNLAVSGISTTTGNPATSHCQVSVIVNNIKPYQQAKGTGPGGAADFSKRNFVLTSKYTTIKPGQYSLINILQYSLFGKVDSRSVIRHTKANLKITSI
jgi:hypothetical protein